jgi:uncharacterized membrane protein
MPDPMVSVTPGREPGVQALLGDGPLPVRAIGTSDLREALARGAADFWDKPSHVVFLALIYPVAGIVLARLVVGYEVLPLLFPLVAGFALIGPFAALGLYEISRRREAGLDASWSHAFEVFRSPGFTSILVLGLLLLSIFFIWMGVAWAIYASTLGSAVPTSVTGFVGTVLTTGPGWAMIVIGNAAGFFFALLVLMISVVSFPLILDRHVGAVTAMRTSIAAVRANPAVMLTWGLIVAAGLVLGLLPLFVGLAIVLPVLGHATWHLYRRVVV